MLSLIQAEFIKIKRSKGLLWTTLCFLIILFCLFAFWASKHLSDPLGYQMYANVDFLFSVFGVLLPFALAVITFLIIDIDMGKWAILYTKNIRIKYLISKIFTILIYSMICFLIVIFGIIGISHFIQATTTSTGAILLISLEYILILLTCLPGIIIQSILHVFLKKGFFAFWITISALVFSMVAPYMAQRYSIAFLTSLLNKWWTIPYFYFTKYSTGLISFFHGGWDNLQETQQLDKYWDLFAKTINFLYSDPQTRIIYIASLMATIVVFSIWAFYFKKRQIKD